MAVAGGAVVGRGLAGRELAGRGGSTGAKVAEMQRSRLLVAVVAAVDEVGYADTAVADIVRRARVSRRTFYEQFANRDECLAALLDDVVATVAEEVAGAERVAGTGRVAGAERMGRSWPERVRVGLWTMLAFLDREPAVARVCVVQVLRGGPELLERRERVLAQLAAAVGEGRSGSARGVNPTPLTAEGVVGAALAIVHARLLRRDGRPLVGLFGELMAIIVLPYRGPAAARRELERPVPVGPRRTADRAAGKGTARNPLVAEDPLEGVPMRLTYRTARVLEGVAELPRASNRQVADYAGVHDPGQISKLLTRLRQLGLLENASAGRAQGEPNAWRLTPLGERVTEQLSLGAERRWRAA